MQRPRRKPSPRIASLVVAETDPRDDERADDEEDDQEIDDACWAHTEDDADEGEEGEDGGDEDACGASGLMPEAAASHGRPEEGSAGGEERDVRSPGRVLSFLLYMSG